MTDNVTRVKDILANIEYYEGKIKEAKAILEADNVRFRITYSKDHGLHSTLEGDLKTDPRLKDMWDNICEHARTTITIAEAQIACYSEKLTLKEGTPI